MESWAEAESLCLPLEQRDEGVSLRAAEAASEFVVELPNQPGDARHHGPSARRGAYLECASIFLAAMASYQAGGLHFVDQGDHVVAVDTERVGELLLVLLVAERKIAEDRERTRGDPQRLESRGEQLGRTSSNLREEERERVGVVRLGKRVHPTKYRLRQ
jgi:hypothetical protein